MRSAIVLSASLGLSLLTSPTHVAGSALVSPPQGAQNSPPQQGQVQPATAAGLKHVRVFIEGDTSEIPKFVKLAQEKGPERKLSFDFTRDKDSGYDVRVVLSAEGSSMWSYAHGNIVVMDNKSNVMFTVTRSERLTAKGATSAMTKEFVKMLSRFYGLTK
jgi:hypothetical protein